MIASFSEKNTLRWRRVFKSQRMHSVPENIGGFQVWTLSGASHFTVVPFPLNVGSTKCANIVISMTRLPYHRIKHYASGLPVWECTQPQLNQWLWAVNPTVSAAPPQALHQLREPTKNKRWRLLMELKQKDNPQSTDDRAQFDHHRRQRTGSGRGLLLKQSGCKQAHFFSRIPPDNKCSIIINARPPPCQAQPYLAQTASYQQCNQQPSPSIGHRILIHRVRGQCAAQT